MRLTQGTFSYLPDLTDEQILAQVKYIIKNGWAVSIEWTEDPHPRNSYWELWGLPLFGIKDASVVMYELDQCRAAHPTTYIKINAFDASRGVESCALSFIVQRPYEEPGFYLERQEVEGRNLRYTIHSYVVTKYPPGERYVL
uniref:Multifunctional fusion protein n=1 Tax=Eustigmatophyceae sp. Ndem 8/9T-3m6.8 TaxID=2506146 RepID=A0A3R5T9J0_9STRA|nr:ribulose-1 5-bisphosphate carboxylase/oxygenase small subunit [Eustigmatophyceae sp. Ndem 8/9T-3m6.8]QAA11833.1 ribulose-1 5-bisphosphate carboxylase/oxygenase small subunit [Eustigmatophyceae sp. Ndem 8/9T-3m6.8]